MNGDLRTTPTPSEAARVFPAAARLVAGSGSSGPATARAILIPVRGLTGSSILYRMRPGAELDGPLRGSEDSQSVVAGEAERERPGERLLQIQDKIVRAAPT